jgi:hypothetical protein
MICSRSAVEVLTLTDQMPCQLPVVVQVRLTCPINVRTHPEGVLHLVRVPAYRAFVHVKVLHLECHVVTCVQHWVEFADAAAAAAAAWPQLEEVALSGQPVNKESEW